MRHLMIDLETLGRSPDSVFTQVGLCWFDLDQRVVTGTELLRVDAQDAIRAGRTVEWATIRWWLAQGEGARANMAQEGERPLWEALEVLRSYVQPTTVVWAKGPSFDIAMLEHAYRAGGHEPPWDYRCVRCVRTYLENAPGGYVRHTPMVAHNAASDAEAQARDVISASEGYAAAQVGGL